jgi:cyclopropane fatty-acyl-phospholipid synthase-like methyltransferase
MNKFNKILFRCVYWFKAPWDVGGPQPIVKELEQRGHITGRVLDVGCGTGDTAIFLAQKGYEVMGIDFIPKAIDLASARAKRAGSQIPFRVFDAMKLDQLHERFDTVIDAGLFHNLSDNDRICYLCSLGSAMEPGGIFHMLCFSDSQPGFIGPRRISREEIYQTFSQGWRIELIRETKYKAYYPIGGAHAWIASIRKV